MIYCVMSFCIARTFCENVVSYDQLLKAQFPNSRLPNVGPGRYSTNSPEVYKNTRSRTDKGGAINKGPPMPIYEDHVLREACEKPAPNSYSGVSELHQQFMSVSLGNVVTLSNAEPVTEIERRCRRIADEPAPGDYEPRLPEPRHRGFKMSKAKRKDLWGGTDVVPGPGSYEGFGTQINTISHRASPAHKASLTETSMRNPKKSFANFLASPKRKKTKAREGPDRVSLPKCVSAEPQSSLWPGKSWPGRCRSIRCWLPRSGLY